MHNPETYIIYRIVNGVCYRKTSMGAEAGGKEEMLKSSGRRVFTRAVRR